MFFKKIQLANNPFCKTLTWVVLAVLVFSTACSTTKVVKRPQPEIIQIWLKKGDTVKISTKEGGYFKLKIIEITSEAITGKLRGQSGAVIQLQKQILFNEIAKIEKTKVLWGRSIALFALGLVLFLAWTAEPIEIDISCIFSEEGCPKE